MKEGRLEGRVADGSYVIVGPQGVVHEIPLEEARSSRKLAAAIKRNGWKEISDGDQ